MGEHQQDTEQQRSPGTGKRPSPTSVKELLDIVHLQQSSTSPRGGPRAREADVLGPSRAGGFNPLPAIGQSAVGAGGPPSPGGPLRSAGEGSVRRSRANSDGCQYLGSLKAVVGGGGGGESGSGPGGGGGGGGCVKHVVLSASMENGAISGLHQRRERTLPPLSQERPPSRQAAVAKTPLRRTSSGGESMKPGRAAEERTRPRPKSSHGRRRPLTCEMMTLPSSAVAPTPHEDDEVFGPEMSDPSASSPRPPNALEDRVQSQAGTAPSRPGRLDRPKSSKGRSRQSAAVGLTVPAGRQGDDWSSEDDSRPRAPSPPSPGLDSDLDSGVEGYEESNGRGIRPR